MTTHAERVREAERAVVEAAILWRDEFGGRRECEVFNAAVDALLALRAATCPTCGGTGWQSEPLRGRSRDGSPWSHPGVPCPAGCEAGKRRER